MICVGAVSTESKSISQEKMVGSSIALLETLARYAEGLANNPHFSAAEKATLVESVRALATDTSKARELLVERDQLASELVDLQQTLTARRDILLQMNQDLSFRDSPFPCLQALGATLSAEHKRLATRSDEIQTRLARIDELVGRHQVRPAAATSTSAAITTPPPPLAAHPATQMANTFQNPPVILTPPHTPNTSLLTTIHEADENLSEDTNTLIEEMTDAVKTLEAPRQIHSSHHQTPNQPPRPASRPSAIRPPSLEIDAATFFASSPATSDTDGAHKT